MAPVIGGGILSLGRNLTEEEAEARFKGQVILVQIELPAYGVNPALTLRFATRRFEDKEGLPWWDRVDAPPSIDYGGGFLETRLHPPAADFTIRDLWVPGQAVGTKFSDLLFKYEFTGARVWIRQAFTDLNEFSEYPTIFDGEITEWDDADEFGVPFHAVHRRAWNIIMPSRVLRQVDWPNAPTEARDTALPLLWGDGRARRYLTHPTLQLDASYAGIARGALPALIIDAPTAAGLVLPKFMVSDRDIDGSEPLDSRWFMDERSLGRLAGPGSATLTNPAGGPATLALDSTLTKVAIIPTDIEPGTPTQADGVQEMLREDKPYTLAGCVAFNHTSSKRLGRWALPDVAPLGTFVNATVYVFYAKNAAGGPGSTTIANRVALTSTSSSFPAGASPTYPSPSQWQQVNSFDVDPTVVGGWEDIKNCYLQIATAGAGQELQGHRIALVVTYRAAAKVERPGVQAESRDDYYVNAAGRRATRENTDVGRLYSRVNTVNISNDLLSFDHPLYGYFRGKLDTDGSITGTPGTLIEHPVDIVRDFLRLSGVPSGEITTTTNVFGSFADAKTALPGYKFLVPLTKQRPAAAFLEDIGGQTLCWFRRRGTQPTAPFVALPWDIGLTHDYRSTADPFVFARTTPWMREGSLRRFRTRISDVVNRLRVNFDWDARTNSYAGSVYISDTDNRVYVGGFVNDYVTTDFDGRRAIALASVQRYGPRPDTINLPWVVDPETATDILWRMFDLLVTPRVGVRFDTFVNAYDLEVGHRIELSSDWDATVAFPRPGSNGSWADKSLVVTNVKRPKDRPVIYEVEAVEITT